jgi:hypothetical protein
MSDGIQRVAALSMPADFRFDEVRPIPQVVPAAPPPSLGPLTAFAGTFRGNGFNTIFRPDSPQTPTVLPTPVGSDNILELNLTSESLSFSSPLGSVPNRGMVQADAFLNGVPYLQVISDITTGQRIGIHFEPGLWMSIPSTTDPVEGRTVVRMASIPHGTTICAQGTFTQITGAPTIPSVNITPFIRDTTQAPPNLIPFASQTAAAQGTPRIPQDLTSFMAAGTITQAILDDPNSLLRNHIAQQRITGTTIVVISTNPNLPLFGGGTDNIAFLLGNSQTPPANIPNAQTFRMSAIFWIETVEVIIPIPIFRPGDPPIEVPVEQKPGMRVAPTFLVRPPIQIPEPRLITVTFTQIQYSQTVLLDFNGLTWPHVSVNTLVPADSIGVPPSSWA